MTIPRSKFRTDAKESDIQKLILDWLAAEKIWHMRLNAGSFAFEHKGKRRFFRAGKPGMADILTTASDGCGMCLVAWIEVKAAKGKQSDDQKAFQKEVEDYGMRYILAQSLDEVIEGMK